MHWSQFYLILCVAGTYTAGKQQHKIDLEEVDTEISFTLTCAWSTGTLRTRNSQWHKYLSFCQDNGLVPFPAEILTIARFLIYLSRTCKYSTINNYLSAIIKLHEYYGCEQSFRDSFVLKMLLNGLKNQLGTHVKQKKSLSIQELCLMFGQVDKKDLNQITLWSAIIFSFRTMLRKCNVVPDGTGDEHVIKAKDIQVTKDGIIVTVDSTKTLRHKERQLNLPVHFVDKTCMCGASLLLTHWSRRVVKGDDYLFYLWKNESWTPVTYSVVA